MVAAEIGRDRWGSGGAEFGRPQPRRGLAAERRFGCVVVERGPGIVGVGPELPAELLPLRGGQERRVVARVAGGRQPPGLDGVGEHHGGLAGRPVGEVEGVEQAGEIMAAEIPGGGGDLGVVEVGEDLGDGASAAVVAGEAAAQVGGRAAQQPLVLLVAHRVDAVPQGVAAGAVEQRPKAPPVLHRDRLPAGSVEHPPDPPDGDVGNDPVERLPVEVDDPQDLAQVRDHGVDERLPHRAFVELGIADEGDVPAARRNIEVAGDVPLGERAPDRRRGADADGAGGEVDRVGVFRPAGVALQAVEGAELGEVAAIQSAEEVVDGVEDRRGVGFHRDPVRVPQVPEIQGRHDAHHRR